MTDAPPPAGWYPHTGMADTQGYWDGSGWTGQVAPGGAAPSPPPDLRAAVGLGWTFGFLLPPLGFLIGLYLMKDRPKDGGAIVVFSIVVIVAVLAVYKM